MYANRIQACDDYAMVYYWASPSRTLGGVMDGTNTRDYGELHL